MKSTLTAFKIILFSVYCNIVQVFYHLQALNLRLSMVKKLHCIILFNKWPVVCRVWGSYRCWSVTELRIGYYHIDWCGDDMAYRDVKHAYATTPPSIIDNYLFCNFKHFLFSQQHFFTRFSIFFHIFTTYTILAFISCASYAFTTPFTYSSG